MILLLAFARICMEWIQSKMNIKAFRNDQTKASNSHNYCHLICLEIFMFL